MRRLSVTRVYGGDVVERQAQLVGRAFHLVEVRSGGRAAETRRKRCVTREAARNIRAPAVDLLKKQNHRRVAQRQSRGEPLDVTRAKRDIPRHDGNFVRGRQVRRRAKPRDRRAHSAPPAREDRAIALRGRRHPRDGRYGRRLGHIRAHQQVMTRRTRSAQGNYTEKAKEGQGRTAQAAPDCLIQSCSAGVTSV